MHLKDLKERGEIKVIPGGNQMCLIRDTEEVLKFLEFVGRKSILNERAVNCRLTACNNLFSVLNEEEDNLEYIMNNLDLLVHRFRNRNPSVRASTMKVYKSRVKSSIEDFRSWSADPFAWERQVSEKAKLHEREQRKAQRAARKAVDPEDTFVAAKGISPLIADLEEEVFAESLETEVPPGKARKVSFPIKPDFTVEVTIPAEGLSLKELRRLGMFLLPYCTDFETISKDWPAVF
jgi:hypothetical protein